MLSFTDQSGSYPPQFREMLTFRLQFSIGSSGGLAGSSRICTCLQCLSNCRCMVLIAASGFLANPGPPNVKYVSQLEHLPCTPDLLFWVISRCGFFMHQVSHTQESRTSPVDFKLHYCARVTLVFIGGHLHKAGGKEHSVTSRVR